MKKPSLVLFNASVVIAGLISPSGGSGKLIQWARERKIIGVVSEIILNEISKHVKIKDLEKTFLVVASPSEKLVNDYNAIVIDKGDAHVLASACELEVDYLVTLDKKHLLSLKKKIKNFKIVSPKELIETLEKET